MWLDIVILTKLFYKNQENVARYSNPHKIIL